MAGPGGGLQVGRACGLPATQVGTARPLGAPSPGHMAESPGRLRTAADRATAPACDPDAAGMGASGGTGQVAR